MSDLLNDFVGREWNSTLKRIRDPQGYAEAVKEILKEYEELKKKKVESKGSES